MSKERGAVGGGRWGGAHLCEIVQLSGVSRVAEGADSKAVRLVDVCLCSAARDTLRLWLNTKYVWRHGKTGSSTCLS